MLKDEKSTRVLKKEAAAKKKEAAAKKAGGSRTGSGRKCFEPTEIDRRQVEALSGYGVQFEQIAALIQGGIHIDTLRTYFVDELIAGKSKANAKIGKAVFQKAMSGDTTAMIWWTKTQMRWAETQRVEVSSTATVRNVIAAEDITEDEWRQRYENNLGAAKGPPEGIY